MDRGRATTRSGAAIGESMEVSTRGEAFGRPGRGRGVVPSVGQVFGRERVGRAGMTAPRKVVLLREFGLISEAGVGGQGLQLAEGECPSAALFGDVDGRDHTLYSWGVEGPPWHTRTGAGNRDTVS